MTPATPLRGDGPLADAAEDLLGFEALADGLAAQIEASLAGGLVLLIRARRPGAGRTSFLNLLHAALTARGLPTLRVCAADRLDLIAAAATPPTGFPAPVLLLDDAGAPEALPVTGRLTLVASCLDEDHASGPGRACLVVDLPEWNHEASASLAERLTPAALAEPASLAERRAWESVLTRARTPREARRLADAGLAACATTDAARPLTLAALAEALDHGGAHGEPPLVAHARRFLGAVPPLAAPAMTSPSETDSREDSPGESGDLGAFEPCGTHDGEEPEVAARQRLCGALARRGDGGAIAELVRLLGDEHAAVRLSASHALATLADGAAAPAVRPLLASPQAAVRRAAAFVLGRLRDEDSRADLVHALNDVSPETRRAAAAALGRLGGRAALRPLLTLLDESHAGVRMAAETALLQAASTLEQGAFDAELLDEASPTHLAALRAAGRLELGAATTLESLLSSRSAESARAAAEALGARGSTRALAALAGAAADERPAVREAALAALARLTNEHPAAVLAGLLASGDPLIRERAATALGRTGDRRAVAPLLALHAEDDPTLRRIAAASLVRLGFGGS